MDLPALPTDRWDRRGAWIAAGLLAGFAVYCLARGMPWPHPDELAFIGAGIDLARTGELVNHGMDGWLAGFGTDRFYIQLPFPIYSLALWFRLFGTHTAGLRVFQWLWCLAGMGGLVRMLGRFGLALGLRLFLAALYLLSMLGCGCRPEPEAVGLLFLGLALVDTAAPFSRRLGALILLGFAFLCYPIVVALAPPFGVALAWLTLPPDSAARGGWRTLARAWALPAVLAVAVTFLVFLAMIRGDLAAFLRVFNAHRSMRAASTHPFAEYLATITRYHEAVLTLPMQGLLAVAAGWVALRWRRIEAGTRTLVAACAVAAVGCIVLYATKATQWTGLLAYVAAAAVISASGLLRWRWPLALALVGFYLASNVIGFVDLALQRFPDPAVLRAARETALASGKVLVLDYSTARYVFDYHYPPGTHFAFYLRLPTPGHPFALAADKKADQIWVVTAVPLSGSGGFVDVPPADRAYPRVRVSRHEFQSLALCPDQPLILP